MSDHDVLSTSATFYIRCKGWDYIRMIDRRFQMSTSGVCHQTRWRARTKETSAGTLPNQIQSAYQHE
jgi:hypothetical protein